MSTNRLITLLNDIKSDKDTNLKPENLKKGVTLLGIQGALEGGTSSGAKIFETQEAMQADTDAKEGDKAIVYRKEIQNMTSDMEVSSITFPEIVILPIAFTSSAYCMIRAVDSSISFDGNCQLSQSSFRFDSWSSSGSIRAEYTSEDGITYTRTRLQGDSGDLTNPVEVPTCKVYNANEWNDNLGYFMQVCSNYFEGFYEYRENYVNKKKIVLPQIKNTIVDFTNKTISYSQNGDITYIDSVKLQKLIIKIIYDRNNFNSFECITFIDTDSKLHMIATTGSQYNLVLMQNSDGSSYYPAFRSSSAPKDTFTDYIIDLDNQTYTSSPISCNSITYDSYAYCYYPNITTQTVPIGVIAFKTGISFSEAKHYIIASKLASDDTVSAIINYTALTDIYVTENIYTNASTQLNAVPENVYNNVFYGKNGLEEGTLENVTDLTADELKHKIILWNILSKVSLKSSITSLVNFFSSMTDLITVPLFNTENITNMANMFDGCTNLQKIPEFNTSKVITMQSMFNTCTSLKEIPLLDTSNVVRMSSMFYDCASLTTIPLMDTSKVTTMQTMFKNCTSLVTIPLINTASVTTMEQMFEGCTSLEKIPLLDSSNVTSMYKMFSGCINLIEIPSIDTSSVTTMQNMFYGCTNLTTLPVLDTSNVTSLFMFVGNCTNLSDESLNNILAICKNATKITITSNKTLKNMGLTEEQANKCKTLSNYSAFTSAGWTTGY